MSGFFDDGTPVPDEPDDLVAQVHDLMRVMHDNDRAEPAAPSAVREIATADLDGMYPPFDWQAGFADEQDDEVEFIVPGIVPAGPRSITFYSGKSGDGKTLIAWEIVAAIATGTDVFDALFIDRPRRVLVLDFENDPRGDIIVRLRAAGFSEKDVANVVLLSFPALPDLSTAQGALHLGGLVDRHHAEVVVIDTADRAVHTPLNDAETWQGFYRNSGTALKIRGVTLIRIDQAGKDPARGPKGSVDKVTDADAVWRLDHQPGARTRTLTLGKHRVPMPDTKIVLGERDDVLRHRLVGSAAQDRANRVAALVAALDEIGVPTDVSRRQASDLLKTAGRTAGKTNELGEAIKIRADGLKVVPGGLGTTPSDAILDGLGEPDGTTP